MSPGLRFWILLAVLVSGGTFVNSWAYRGERQVARQQLKHFPTVVGDWKQEGVDQYFDVQTMNVLRATDYVLRGYRSSNGAQANLYIGYYQSQSDGVSYHSPLNCLPGSGWSMTAPALVAIPAPDGKSFAANKYVIENGANRQMMIYWYQGRGRAVASEYWSKIYTVIDSVRHRRSDAAMVRVLVPITGSDASALGAAKDFAAATTRVLPDFVPN